MALNLLKTQANILNNILVEIIVFDKEKKKVLLNKIEDPKAMAAAQYRIPNGYVLSGESLNQAVKRILRKENDIILDDILYVGQYSSDKEHSFVFASIVKDVSLDKFEQIRDISDIKLPVDSLKLIEKVYDGVSHSSFINIHIDEIIDDVIDKIAQNAVVKKKLAGWDHFVKKDQERIGIMGTAYGLNILDFSNKSIYDELRKKAYNLLHQKQSEEGGWGLKSTNNKFNVTQSTCCCADAIFKYQKGNTQITLKARKWLLENRLEDFSWGCHKNSESRITTTCMAITTLSKIAPNENLEESFHWLIEKQDPRDGYWKLENDDESSRITATSLALSTLNIKRNKYELPISKGISWVEKKIYEKNEFKDIGELFFINNTDRFHYNHSTLINLLSTLIELRGINNVSPIFLYDILYKIISSRHESGFWEHSLMSSNFPIWHTYNILRLFVYIQKSGIVNLSYIKEVNDLNQIQIDLINLLVKK